MVSTYMAKRRADYMKGLGQGLSAQPPVETTMTDGRPLPKLFAVVIAGVTAKRPDGKPAVAQLGVTFEQGTQFCNTFNQIAHVGSRTSRATLVPMNYWF